jgi:hypothetical protein
LGYQARIEFTQYFEMFGPKEVSSPENLCLHENQIFVCDSTCIKVFQQSTGKYLFQLGSAHDAHDKHFIRPSAVAVANDDIFVTDFYKNDVQVFSLTRPGAARRWTGQETKTKGSHRLCCPSGLYLIKNPPFVLVSNAYHDQIVVFTLRGQVNSTIGNGGTRRGEFRFPTRLCGDDCDDHLFVVDSQNNRVQKINLYSETSSNIAVFRLAEDPDPTGIAVHGDELFISYPKTAQIVVFDRHSAMETRRIKFQRDLLQPMALTISTELYITDVVHGKIIVVH